MGVEDVADLAMQLDRIMRERGWGPREAGRQVGLSHWTIGKITGDPEHIPDLETLDKLAQGFSVPLRRFIEWCGFKVDDAPPPRLTVLTDEQVATIEAMTPEEIDAMLAFVRAAKTAPFQPTPYRDSAAGRRKKRGQ